MILYNVAEVRNGALFRGREANDPEVTCVDRFYYCVDGNPLFFVQRKPYLSGSKELIVRSHKNADIGCMYCFFAPVMFPKRFNFFSTAKEGALNKRLINCGD